MTKAEQQAINFFDNKQDADLAGFLQSQPLTAGAAHLSLQRLAEAGLPKAYTALLQSEMTTQQDQLASVASPASAFHQLIGSITEKGMPFVTDVIVAMHAAGISLNFTNVDKDTPLHLAARTGQLQLCQLLIQYGADALARNVKNRWAICGVKILNTVAVVSGVRHYAGRLVARPSWLLKSSHSWLIKKPWRRSSVRFRRALCGMRK